MSANLVRIGGGLAAMAGGVLGVIASLLAIVFVLPEVIEAMTDPTSGPPYSGIIILTGLLLILTWVLVLGGLVGLHASQRHLTGPLGVVGFWLALVGTVILVVVLCLQTFYIPGIPSDSGVTDIAIVVGIVAVVTKILLTIGFGLFGWATYRARLYPRAAAVLLVVGAIFNLLLSLQGGEFIVMAVAIAWLGFFLFRGRVSSMEQQPERL